MMKKIYILLAFCITGNIGISQAFADLSRDERPYTAGIHFSPGNNDSSTFFTDSIYSKYLQEYRRMNIYLPPAYQPGGDYPVIYATDGTEFSQNNSVRLLLDSLIYHYIIRPVVYIEVYRNPKNVDTVVSGNNDTLYVKMRNYEYVESMGRNSSIPQLQNAYRNHLLFFTDEMIPVTQQRFGLIYQPVQRYFYGFSNGAGFGISMMSRHPSLIGTYLCYSPLGSGIAKLDGNRKKLLKSRNADYPRLLIAYGNVEAPFFAQEAGDIEKACKKYGMECDLTVFDGGHEMKMWNAQLTRDLVKLFSR